MDCRVLREISVKSDGYIHCDDSNGYSIHLGALSESPNWNVKTILQGPIYEHIRRSFSNGVPPWGDTCRNCDLFNFGDSPQETILDRVALRVEPTLACELSCAYCKRKREVRNRDGDWHLSSLKLKQLVSSCLKNKIDVSKVSYLGWGEPLNHPDFSELVTVVKNYYPNAYQEVTTVAQADFKSVVGDVPIDLITISCDGVTQNAYEKYRRNGVIDNVFKFMEDSKKYKSNVTKIIWKYILFNHNDSDDNIIDAQNIADKFDIDELHFVFTNTDNQSLRYSAGNVSDVPIISSKARVVNAAALQKVERNYLSSCKNRSLNKSSITGWIDKLYSTNGGLLVCEGWALSKSENDLIVGLSMSIKSGRSYQAISVSEPRVDVAESLDLPEKVGCGFVVQIPIETELTETFKIQLSILTDREVISYSIPIINEKSRFIPFLKI